jgi:hypothetical protein
MTMVSVVMNISDIPEPFGPSQRMMTTSPGLMRPEMMAAWASSSLSKTAARHFYRESQGSNHPEYAECRLHEEPADRHATGEYEDFLTGFVLPHGAVRGRAVGVTQVADGSLLVSDNGSCSIWHVSYVGK